MSGTIVIALHVGLVAALAYGLTVVVDKPVERSIVFTPIIDTPIVDPPLPPPVNPTRRDDVFVPEPDVITDASDETPQGPTIVATRDDGGGNQVAFARPAQSIMSTHTRPPYPPISVRLNETGIVSLRLVISADGRVEDAVVTRSSGHQRLDDAAVAWVKAQWRYQPAEQNGRPVASTTSAQMKFELTGR